MYTAHKEHTGKRISTHWKYYGFPFCIQHPDAGLRAIVHWVHQCFLLSPEKDESGVLNFDKLKLFESPHCRAHCADSVVVITRRCQRLNPGSSPGRRIVSLLGHFLTKAHCGFTFLSRCDFLTLKKAVKSKNSKRMHCNPENISIRFHENAQCIFMQVKNSNQK